MKKPNPELSDDENPEWTDETFANAAPFSALPAEVQELLKSPKQVREQASAAAERIRARAARPKTGRFDWTAPMADRDKGRP
jgi:hypothetical protein